MKPKYIETPEKMWELFKEYMDSLEPRAIEKATPKGVVVEMHQTPLTMDGFEVYCFDKGFTVEHYFRNTNDAYNDYCGICSHIKKVIRKDQIEGGMVGQYNPSITQRLNGLTEKTDVTTGGERIGKIEIEIVKGEDKGNDSI